MDLKPIGHISTNQKHPYEAPRQGVLTKQEGLITLENPQFGEALRELEGFERIWLIYLFHHNSEWKPLVKPPRGPDHKIGVFATRSPYRPNPLGLSCVKLIKIEGLKIYVSEHDLLDGTPILDIKPYIPYADAFSEARAGWLENIEEQKFNLSFSEISLEQLNLLENLGVGQIRSFCEQQLSYHPTDFKRKRLIEISSNEFILCYRTWRIEFKVDLNLQQISVEKIFSGYTEAELLSPADPYEDKEIHHKFLKH